MRYFFTTSFIFFSLVLSSQDNRFLDSLKSILPASFEIESVSVSPQEGFYEVKLSDGSLLYISNDGKSIFYGDLLRITDEGILNLSDESKAKARLEKIEELDAEIIDTLIERAEEALLEIAIAEMDEESVETEIDNTLESLKSLKPEHIELLKNAGIKDKENLADLSTDELSPILDLTEEEAGKIIMDARSDWFN